MEDLLRAAKAGDEEGAMRLVDEDSMLLEMADPEGDRALKVAAEHGHMGVVRVLVDRGAKVNATGSRGMRALHWAAAGGHEEVVDFLLGKGARPTPKDEAGLTPLMMAAEWGHVGVVWMLAQHMGTQGLDQRTSYGWTALHYATEGGHDEAVCCLLMCGADPRIRNKEGKTPRGIAEEEDMWGRVNSLSVFQWWEGELERGYLLSRATSLHKAHTMQRDMPTSQVPTYLEARVAAGHAVPRVEVVSPQSQGQRQGEEDMGASGKRKAAGEGRDVQGADGWEEVSSMLEYVVTGLNEELVTELLEGFHCGK